MSCFGGLSQVLSNIGQVLRLHCGTIVCAPGGSGQETAEQLPLAGRGSAQEAGDDSVAAAAAAAKGTLSCCWLAAGWLLMALLAAVYAAGGSHWLCLLLVCWLAGRLLIALLAAVYAARGLCCQPVLLPLLRACCLAALAAHCAECCLCCKLLLLQATCPPYASVTLNAIYYVQQIVCRSGIQQPFSDQAASCIKPFTISCNSGAFMLQHVGCSSRCCTIVV